MEGRLKDLTVNRDGSQNVTVTVYTDMGDLFDELKDVPVEVEIKKAVKHRSMEANRYAWLLIDKIAEKVHRKKEEIYRHAIREIGGVSTDALMKADAVIPFRQIWEKQRLGNQVEIVDEDLDTGECSIRIYFGSSTYNTAQMSLLLDSLIQDAESLGIPTITPKEEERMLGKWAKKKEREGKQNESSENQGQDV